MPGRQFLTRIIITHIYDRLDRSPADNHNMTRMVIISLIAILSVGSFTAQAEPYRADNEFIINIPLGWNLRDTTAEYPFHLTDIDRSAELFIFRSTITADETIDNEQMLRVSVEAVIDGVLPEMSAPELRRSAGYLSGDHASFVIDFMAIDSMSGASVYHRLKGILYRMRDDSQTLFTLWAKSSPEDFPYHEPAFDYIMESFEYIGPRQGDVFATDHSRVLWYLLFATGGLAATAIYVGRLRQRRARLKLSRNINFWQCGCGRLNHNTRPTCRRCGHAQEVAV